MSISLSESAVKHICKIAAATGIRLEVLGGGCSGYQYKFGFAENVDPAEDTVVERNGAKLVVDKTSLAYLEGSEIDYGESLMESGFLVRNPLAASSCGCGTSFSVKE